MGGATKARMCLRSTTGSRSMRAPTGAQLVAATERAGPPPMRRDGACVASETAIIPATPRPAPFWPTSAPTPVRPAPARPTSAPASVPQLLAGQVDEHRLQARLGTGQVHECDPPPLRG